MSYWSYPRVRDVLSSSRPMVVVEGMAHWNLQNLLKSEELKQLVEVYLSEDEVGFYELKERYTHIVAQDLIKTSGKAAADYESLRLGLDDILRGLVGEAVVREVLRDTTAPRFFLEPTIASALSTTSVKGLTCKDLPPVPVPLSLHVPHGLIKLHPGDKGWRRAIYLDSLYIAAAHDMGEGVSRLKLLIGSSYNLSEVEDADRPLVTRGINTAHVSVFSGDKPLDYLISGRYQRMETVLGDENSDTEDRKNIAGRLLVNLLLYWKSDNVDILQRLNPEYTKARDKINGTKGKKREKRQLKLRKIPKNEHLILGQSMEVVRRRQEDELRETSSSTSTGSGIKVSKHWTRGHWKWQPCGPNRISRKLIFVEDYVKGSLPMKEKLGYSVRS